MVTIPLLFGNLKKQCMKLSLNSLINKLRFLAIWIIVGTYGADEEKVARY